MQYYFYPEHIFFSFLPKKQKDHNPHDPQADNPEERQGEMCRPHAPPPSPPPKDTEEWGGVGGAGTSPEQHTAETGPRGDPWGTRARRPSGAGQPPAAGVPAVGVRQLARGPHKDTRLRSPCEAARQVLSGPSGPSAGAERLKLPLAAASYRSVPPRDEHSGTLTENIRTALSLFSRVTRLEVDSGRASP